MAMDFKKSASKLAEEYRNKTATGGDNSIAKGIRSMMSAEGTENQIQYIPLVLIDTFKDHPFHVRDDEEMEQLVESICESGVLTPATVRKKDGGRYEMISGHRRKHACERAGLTEIPAIVLQMDDEEAIIRMVDANLQREEILPSEKAFAYKMKLDAMKRKSGRRSKENVSQVGTQKRSDQIMAEQIGESRNQIQRFIRLTELIQDFRDCVDTGHMSFLTGVSLSYLTADEQATLLRVLEEELAPLPNMAQAEELKKRSKSGGIDEVSMREILFPERYVKKPTVDNLTVRQAEAAQREQAETVRREREESEQDAVDAAFDAKWAARKEEPQQTFDPDEEPLAIVTGESGTSVMDDKLHVFFQAAEGTHEAMLDQGNAERTAKAICKRLESLQAWFEANADKDTLDRFSDLVSDLDELLNAQGLLK